MIVSEKCLLKARSSFFKNFISCLDFTLSLFFFPLLFLTQQNEVILPCCQVRVARSILFFIFFASFVKKLLIFSCFIGLAHNFKEASTFCVYNMFNIQNIVLNVQSEAIEDAWENLFNVAILLHPPLLLDKQYLSVKFLISCPPFHDCYIFLFEKNVFT